jgi:hypothetical protein
MSSIPLYAIFGGETYYPAGGFEDFYGFADSFQEALKIYEEALTIGSKPMKDWWGQDRFDSGIPRDWVHIVNLKTKKIVVNSKDNPKIRERLKIKI